MTFHYFNSDVTAAIIQVGEAATDLASAALLAAKTYARSVDNQETVVNVNVNLEGSVSEAAVEQRVRNAVTAALKHSKKVQDR